jgi:hypothetical protein
MTSPKTWEKFKQKVREARPDFPPYARAFCAMLLYVLENADEGVFKSNQTAILARLPFTQYNMMVGPERDRQLFFYTPFGDTIFVTDEKHFLDETTSSDALLEPIQIVYPDCLDRDELKWTRFPLPFGSHGQNAINLNSFGKWS